MLFPAGWAVEFLGGLVKFKASIGGVVRAPIPQSLHRVRFHWSERARDLQIFMQYLERIHSADQNGDGE